METRNDQQACSQNQEEQKRPKSRLERWIEKLEERIAPECHTNPHGKDVGCQHYRGY
jgi:hypothetical protein